MVTGVVGRTLYRELLRVARRGEGIPVEVCPSDIQGVFHTAAEDSSLVRLSGISAASDSYFSAVVTRYAQQSFRNSSQLQEDAAEVELDRGFQALRLLNTAYTPKLQRLEQDRARHSCKEGVLYPVGQVFRHKNYGYKGVIYGWHHSCERDPTWAQSLGVRWDQPFYEVFPDEDESHRIFGATRLTKYVAQENIEAVLASRVMHRAIHSYFTGFSKELGRYIPGATLQYTFPDAYEAPDVEPIGNDSNLLIEREVMPNRHEAEHVRRRLLVDVG